MICTNAIQHLVNDNDVNSAIVAAIFSAKPMLVLSPVPTAVPPMASSNTLGKVFKTRCLPYFNWVA